ncbi:MAG: hypothetical protein FE834_09380 [Gammaproteobacteria bacterium]|nr:hypothetical protein [Gammaproteobacteria bacterium]
MNGRVYDPSIGRFLSADSNIQAPYNTQSYNRYSYTINNPLKYTDPSGHFFGIFIGFIASMITKQVAIAIGTKLLLAKVAIAYGVSYVMTYAATGDAKAAQGAGLSAGLFTGIRGLRGGNLNANGKMQYNPGWESGSMKTLAAHGLAGGIVQDKMGGSFGAGFLASAGSSYFGSSASSNGDTATLIGNTVRDAVIGGTMSVIGGGKFANGAQAGAFRYLFNEGMRAGQGLKVRFSTKDYDDGTTTDFYESAEDSYISGGGNPNQVRKEFSYFSSSPRGAEIMSQSGTLTIYPGSASAPFGKEYFYYSGGHIDSIAHEIGHTSFGGSYLDYLGQDILTPCGSCRVGNVQVNQNPFRRWRGVKNRNTYTETGIGHPYEGHMFWTN